MRHLLSRAILVAATAAITVIATVGSATGASATHGPAARSAPDSVLLMHNLRALQAATDAGGGNRAPGTAGFTNATTYVESTLRKAGYHVVENHFTFNYTQVLASNLRILPDGDTQQIQVINYTPSTPVGGITGTLVAVPTAGTNGCDAADYDGLGMSGNIALLMRGGCPFSQKQAIAAGAGAIAVVLYNNVPGKIFGSLSAPTDGLVPIGAVTEEFGQQLAALVAAGPVQIQLEVRELLQQRESFNITADTRSGDPNNTLVVGAHLDTIPESPGINDNASGVAATLTLAQWAAHVPLHRRLRFAFWSAEEWGQVGSENYLATLDPTALSQITGYIDLAKLASPNYIRGIFDAADVDGSGGPTGPDGSLAIENALISGFTLQHLSWEPVDLDGLANSDWLSFYSSNVPISGLFTGSEDNKTDAEAALFGGTAGAPYDPCHALACDRIPNINQQVFTQNLRTAALALIQLELAPRPVTRAIASSPARARARAANHLGSLE